MESLNDKESVLAYIKNDIGRFSLEDVPENLRDDKDVVLAAVKNNGMDVFYASTKLRDNF